MPPTLQYALDPVHNYSSPVLSWQAALLFTDIKKDLCIKEGIRGGVAMISHQYAGANAPGMENYNTSKRDSYIMYFDANSLCGWAMSQPLSTSNFKWVTDKEMEELDVMMVSDDSLRGYILEHDFGKYYFNYLYISLFFIMYNFPLSYVFQSSLMIS